MDLYFEFFDFSLGFCMLLLMGFVCFQHVLVILHEVDIAIVHFR